MQTTCRYALALAAVLALPAAAAEWPYFVAYSHQMEEPGNLEIATRSVAGRPDGGNRFLGSVLELEYGVTAWWTSELYLAGQSTVHEGTVGTGVRWENRFRLLAREHWINPVLYVEFENVNEADKSLLEVVGHDGQADLAEATAERRAEREKELELKLILGSNFKGWNLSENFIVEKNLSRGPYEFGYAVGLARPLALVARPDPCNFCPENFIGGIEFYGGLGDHTALALRDTAHYVAPTIAWRLGSGTTLKLSPGFGLTSASAPFLLRFGVSYEIAQFGRLARSWFR